MQISLKCLSACDNFEKEKIPIDEEMTNIVKICGCRAGRKRWHFTLQLELAMVFTLFVDCNSAF